MSNCTMQRPGCLEVATYYPVLLLTPDAVRFGRGDMPELGVCGPCKETITVKDLIPNDDTWATLVKTFRMRGLLGPQRNLTSIEWVKITSPDNTGT